MKYGDILLYDTSYTIFNTIYSIIKDKNELNDYKIDVFLNIYKKLFCKRIYRTFSRHRINPQNAYFIRDCPRNDIWRKVLSNKYKSTTNKSYNSKIGDIFTYTYTKILPYFVEKYRCNIIKIDNAEADDVISLFTKHFIYNKIIVISNDRDLYQLNNLQNISYYSFSGYCKDDYAKIWYDKINNSMREKNIFCFIQDKQFINLKCIPNYIEDNFNNLFNNSIKYI